MGSDDADKLDNSRGSEPLNSFPVRKFAVTVDKDFVLKNKVANATDSIVGEMRLDIPKGFRRMISVVLNIGYKPTNGNAPSISPTLVYLGFDQF